MEPKMSFFRLEFEKIIAIFVIRTVNIYQNRNNLAKRKKNSIWKEKCLIFGIFWDEVWESHCHVWNQNPQISLYTKFHTKRKNCKFGTKNTYFGFWGKIWKDYCRTWNQYLRLCQKLILINAVNFSVGFAL